MKNFIKNLPIEEKVKLETLLKQQIAEEELAHNKQEEAQATRGFAKGFDKKRRK
jgi:hypothetical protein